MIRKEWKDRIVAAEDRIAAAAEEMSTWLWSHPEISDQEFGASRYLAEKAAEKGFKVTIPFAGLETAFLAEFTLGAEKAADDAGAPGDPSACGRIPTAAFLAEYDALPGYGDLSPDGSGNGHACGHNWIAAAAFAAAVIVVFFIRRLETAHSWTIAIILGTVVELFVLLFGDMQYDTNIDLQKVFISVFLSLIIEFLVEFFCFMVDYTRIENVQFEDDDYYYYVKAVPKVTVSDSLRVVKTISTSESSKDIVSQP